MSFDTGLEEYRVKSFAKMAHAVETALQNLRSAENEVEARRQDLAQAVSARNRARSHLQQVKKDLFESHPELAPETEPVAAFTPVNVDDDAPPEFRETSV